MQTNPLNLQVDKYAVHYSLFAGLITSEQLLFIHVLLRTQGYPFPIKFEH